MLEVLLTGKNGFLGKIITDTIKNCKIDGLGANSNNTISCDLSSDIPVIEKKYDFIVHAAGKAHVIHPDKAKDSEFFNVNFNGTINLIRGINTSGFYPDQFIFISTVAVYGADQGENIDEDFPLNGLSAYAKSKIEAEKYLIDWGNKNNIPVVILRLPLVIGPNAPGNFGRMVNGIKSGRYLSIGGGKAKKSMVLGKDVAKLISKLKNKRGIYNLTDGYHPTFEMLELNVSKLFKKNKPKNIPLWLAKFLAKAGDLYGKLPLNTDSLNKITSTLTFSDNKAREELKWKPGSVLSELGKAINIKEVPD